MKVAIDFYKTGLTEFEAESITCNRDYLYILKDHKVIKSYALKDIYQWNTRDNDK